MEGILEKKFFSAKIGIKNCRALIRLIRRAILIVFKIPLNAISDEKAIKLLAQ